VSCERWAVSFLKIFFKRILFNNYLLYLSFRLARNLLQSLKVHVKQTRKKIPDALSLAGMTKNGVFKRKKGAAVQFHHF
jgi:hypothetical protein